MEPLKDPEDFVSHKRYEDEIHCKEKPRNATSSHNVYTVSTLSARIGQYFDIRRRYEIFIENNEDFIQNFIEEDENKQNKLLPSLVFPWKMGDSYVDLWKEGTSWLPPELIEGKKSTFR